MNLVNLSAKGQLVLPKNIREHLGLMPGAQLKIELVDDKIIIEKVVEAKKSDWRRWGGAFRGSRMLADHQADDLLEVEHDEQGI